MNQPDHSAPRGPKTRRDRTAPASLRSGTRRGGDRRPYPTAPTRTRPGPAEPTTARTAMRSPRPVGTLIPATVWVSGATPVDPAATWPTSIVATIVSSFSEPGARVALLPWPAAARPSPATIEPDPTAESVAGTEHEDGFAYALTAIGDLDRSARVLWVDPGPAVAVAGSRPSSVGVGQVGRADSHEDPDAGNRVRDGDRASPEAPDLIITSVSPRRIADDGDRVVGRVVDQVALVAARSLRVGGIFVVLTHCDWSSGVLLDPSGPVVTSGQSADLLYLQHIVALHRPVRDGSFASEATRPDDTVEETRAHGAALGHGLPGPHRRIHSDVYVFAQPHDHNPPPYLRTAPL